MVHSGRGYWSCTSVALGPWDDWSKGGEKAGLGILSSGIGEGRRRLSISTRSDWY
jgi:hypothetical protein